MSNLWISFFSWIFKKNGSIDKIYRIDDNTVRKDNPEKYILDFEYPEELHNLRNDYPLAPAKTDIKEKMPADYCKKLQINTMI